nr:hypothetical protein [uncultured bacterium]
MPEKARSLFWRNVSQNTRGIEPAPGQESVTSDAAVTFRLPVKPWRRRF